MVRDINKDTIFLSIKSSKASIMDMNIAIDLLDTLEFHKNECVGLAANMIGFSKCIIVFYDERKDENRIMFNPVIKEKSQSYEAVEGCLSLLGTRKTTRYEKIVVLYDDMSFKKREEVFLGFTAQIIQHEIDMTNGILI